MANPGPAIAGIPNTELYVSSGPLQRFMYPAQGAPITVAVESPITPADQAEAYFLLVSRRLSKTTGQVITVDGGLHEAFLR